MAAHANDPVVIPPFTLAPLDEPSNVNKERVPASNWEVFALPLLEVLAAGKSKRKEVFAGLEEVVRGKLLPGDYRKVPSGMPVWSFRAGWKLSELREEGFVINPEPGQWRITDAGRQRLKDERASWDPKSFSVGYADVLVEGAPEPAPDIPRPTHRQRSRLSNRCGRSSAVNSSTFSNSAFARTSDLLLGLRPLGDPRCCHALERTGREARSEASSTFRGRVRVPRRRHRPGDWP